MFHPSILNPGRFYLEEGYSVPFESEELFDYSESIPPPIESDYNSNFLLRELSNESEEFKVIENYIVISGSDRFPVLRDTLQIYQVMRPDENLIRFPTANWFLWAGLKRAERWSVLENGLLLPPKPKSALFFSSSFARVLHSTDLEDCFFQNLRLSQYNQRVSYSDVGLSVLLCEVALGAPLFVNSRLIQTQTENLDSQEKATKGRLDPYLEKFEKDFKVTRYQLFEERFDDGVYRTVDETKEVAKVDGCNSVVTCNGRFEPRDATTWRGRILADGELVRREEKDGIDANSNRSFNETFVWDPKQVAIRYLVDFKVDDVFIQ